MKKLNCGFYQALTLNGITIARFTKKEDAILALPSKPRCFGNPIYYGTVIAITKETLAFNNQPFGLSFNVYESFQEYLTDIQTKNQQKEEIEYEL